MKSLIAFAACAVVSAAAWAQQIQPIQIANTQAVAGPAPQISYIVGTATNTTDKPLSYVAVTFNLYDAQNAQVGNAIDLVTNIAPGGTWKFRATTTVPFDHYKLSRVDAH